MGFQFLCECYCGNEVFSSYLDVIVVMRNESNVLFKIKIIFNTFMRTG